MSFIGSLDQFDLSIILQKIEEYHKTGLLVVKQEERSVELSFQEGQFLCIGPVKPNVSLGERLLQAGVISQDAQQMVEKTLGEKRYSEPEAALAFLNSGYVDKSSLLRWAAIEATQVLEALLTWQLGDIYFEADVPMPSQRLLIALSISSLLSTIPVTSVFHPGAVATVAPEPYFSTSSFLSGFEMSAGGGRDTDPLKRLGEGTGHTHAPQRVVGQIPPIQVNIAMMQPDTVLNPADLFERRESDQPVYLTPDQWRLLTRADGQTTLLLAAHELAMSRDQVCQTAGELVELGLVTLSQSGALTGYSQADFQYAAYAGSQLDVVGDTALSYPAQGYVTPAAMPAFQRGQMPIETDSQWGNGGNGATFVLGNGWVVAPPAPTKREDREVQRAHQVYAQAG